MKTNTKVVHGTVYQKIYQKKRKRNANKIEKNF